jgi:hypothetical protein
MEKECKKTRMVDFRQQKGLFAHTTALFSLSDEKNAVPLHRQKEQNPGDKDNNIIIKVGALRVIS